MRKAREMLLPMWASSLGRYAEHYWIGAVR